MKNGKACYVEIDPYAAAWLENLVARGVIAPGDVMCRSVTDIRPEELADYSQVHLYAGIGIHSYAMRRAGIPDTANVWTFSEPCQPFSDAGKGLGFADQRYLRPYTNHLVEQCRPAICLGEQVASNDGLGWLDIVQSDFERAGYACGAQDTCSAGVGAPHIRQRLRVCAVSEEWLADTNKQLGGQGRADARRLVKGIYAQSRAGLGSNGGVEQLGNTDNAERETRNIQSIGTGPRSECIAQPSASNILVHAERAGLERLGRHGDDGNQPGRIGAVPYRSIGTAGGVISMADSDRERCMRLDSLLQRQEPGRQQPDCVEASGCGEDGGRAASIGHNSGAELGRPGATNGFWQDADWLYCRDGKWRPVEGGTFPLAHGDPARVGRLRAFGNAIDAEATAAFYKEVAEVLGLI